jgi:pyruvate/2-oxoglutarate dehydrogenase complex dihydrolipoamide acyltransferase (E2) component
MQSLPRNLQQQIADLSNNSLTFKPVQSQDFCLSNAGVTTGLVSFLIVVSASAAIIALLVCRTPAKKAQFA